MNVLFYVALKMVDDLVNVTVFQVVIALKLVSVNFGSWLYQFAHDLFSDAVFTIWDNAGLNFAAALKHSHHDRFATSTLHAALAAHALAF